MADVYITGLKFVELGDVVTSTDSPPGVSRQIVVETDQAEFTFGMNPTHIPISLQRTVGYDDVGSINWQVTAQGFLVEDGFLSAITDSQTLGEDYKGTLYLLLSSGAYDMTIQFDACLGNFSAEKSGLEQGRVNCTFYGFTPEIVFDIQASA